MSGLGVFAEHTAATAKALDQLPAKTARAVGFAGKDILMGEARRRWGSDRKWSGAVRSRKKSASRPAGASYKVLEDGNRIEWRPTGTPWYVAVKGRPGGKEIKPRTARFLATPYGPRATVKQGLIVGEGNVWTPRVPQIERDAVKAVHTEWLRALSNVYARKG